MDTSYVCAHAACTSSPLLWCQVLIWEDAPHHTHTLSLPPVNPLAEDWCDQDLSQSVFPASAPGTQPEQAPLRQKPRTPGTLE